MTPTKTAQTKRSLISGKIKERRAEKAFDSEPKHYKFDKHGKISSYTKFLRIVCVIYENYNICSNIYVAEVRCVHASGNVVYLYSGIFIRACSVITYWRFIGAQYRKKRLKILQSLRRKVED
ncbi:MAG: hypothetical protein QW421_03290, partial [Archaeoglobaceae archaeon]